MGQSDPPDWVNVGTGSDVTIREVTELVASVVGYEGRIDWDTSKPDGTPRKLMDVSRMTALGWKSKISLLDGLKQTYSDFKRELLAGSLRGSS
jgi:GDP-L-fucose synthase